MDPWQIFIDIGKHSVTIIVLGWLARSLCSQLLSKELERFKADLSSASITAIERLKHDHQVTALEHQVRFSKLHERRAEVVAEVYSLIVEVKWASQSFASPMEWSGEPKKDKKYYIALKKLAEFCSYFDKNRIYLPQLLCEQFDIFILNIRREVNGFGVYAEKEDFFLNPGFTENKSIAWIKASTYFDQEAPKILSALEIELRGILGAP